MMKAKALFLLLGTLALTACQFGHGGSENASNSPSSSSETSISDSSGDYLPFDVIFEEKLDIGQVSSISADLPPYELDEPISVAFEDPLAVRFLSFEPNCVSFYPLKEGTLLFTVSANGETVVDTLAVEDVPSGYSLIHVGGMPHVYEPLPVEFSGPDGEAIPMSNAEFRLISGSEEPSRLSTGSWYFETPGIYSFGLAKSGEKACSNIVTLNVAPSSDWVSLLFSVSLADGTPLELSEAKVPVGAEITFELSHTDGTSFKGHWEMETEFLAEENFEEVSDHVYRATGVGMAAFRPEVYAEPGGSSPNYYISPAFVVISAFYPGEETPYSLEVRGNLDGKAVFFNDMSGEFVDTGIDLVSEVAHPTVEPTAELASVSTGSEPGILFRFEKDGAADNVYSVYACLERQGSFPVYFFWGNAASDLIYFHAYDPNEGLFLVSAGASEALVGEGVALSYSVNGLDSGYAIEYVVEGPGSYSLSEGTFVAYEEGTYTLRGRFASSSVYASFEAAITVISDTPLDPYEGVDKDEFYSDYEPATDATDAYYRSLHGLMSGSLEVPGPEPTVDSLAPTEGGLFVKNSAVDYVERGKGYVVYDARGNEQFTVYEDGAYITLEEVAAYIQAFGKVPANYYEDRYDYPSPEVSPWGEYLRLNDSYFSGDTDRYPYEPLLPDISGEGGLTDYYEVDIGTTGTYTGPSYPVRIYNDGHTITRGGARIVYAKYRLGEEIAASDRHLFYTYNHYNDFQEYLNYYQGWGQIFGNVTAGGEIDEVAPGGPTPYVDVVLQDLY